VSEGRAAGSGSRLELQPALDGLRGVAVISVLLYHGGVPWMQGGFLGVEAFFVLSGFLITSLLLAEWSQSGRVRLGNFWGRRGRRLLPALFCVVAVTGLEQAIVGPGQAVPGFRADGVSTLLYYANWNQIMAGNGYFQQTGLVSPLQHTWSLAIEEQFYVIWPLLLLGVLLAGGRLAGGHLAGGRLAGRLRVGRLRAGRRPAQPRETSLRLLLAVAAAGAVASAVEMALLYHGGSGVNRVYYGTDTRAQGLLMGATLAIALALRNRTASRTRRPRSPTAARLHLAAALGLLGAAGYSVSCVTAGGSSGWLYEGGFLAVDALVVSVILASLRETVGPSPLRAVLSWRPLRAIGLISYGLYLWHFPLFLWLTAQSTGVGGSGLLFVRLGVTVAVSVISYYVVEQPIRRRRVPKMATRALAPTGFAAALAAVLVASSIATASPAPAHALRLPVSMAAARRTRATCRAKLPFFPITVWQTFHLCPVDRVMFVGDSIALTLGLELGLNEQRFGTLLAIRGELGCSFVTRGPIEVDGTFRAENKACVTQFASWRRDSVIFRPDAVVVEMGWWDSTDQLWGTRVVHLGQPAFDRYLLERVRLLVRDVAPDGQPVVLLSVPWTNPPAWPNGEEPPAASPRRHAEIDALLAEAAARSGGQVHFFDLGPYVTPNGRFQADVWGGICRSSDGIHFYDGPSVYDVIPTYCTEKVQAALFPYLRYLVRLRRIGARQTTGP
jgi:peptidoglycan/LPS O-acetylase OafA/YrhL